MTTCVEGYEFLGDNTPAEEETLPEEAPEIVELPKKEGDYEFIIGSDEKEPDRGWFEHLQTISGPQKVAKNAMSMVYNHIMDSSPTELVNPFALVGVIAQATLAAGVQEIHGKPAEIDYKEQIDTASKRLEEGKNGFSEDQYRTVKSWIAEAETRLKNYLVQKPVGTEITISSAPTPPQEKKREVVVDSDDEMGYPYPYPNKWRLQKPTTPTVVIPRITFRNLLEGSKDSKNPRMELLQRAEPKLYTVLTALTGFLKFPYIVQSVDRDDVTKNMVEDPALGSSVFVSNLKDRAYMLVQSLKTPDLKRVLLAISGPGTAKSTGCQLMFKWAKFPCCMLSGEAFRNMTEGRRDTFQIFIDWVVTQIINAGVLGIGILLDDWHFAMEDGGPFDKDNLSSRERFILFIKNCGDSTQKSVIYFDLADGRKFPLNFQYIHLAMTFNRVPEDIYETADAAIRSRYFNLNATYATPEDRMEMAYNLYIPQIKRAVAEKLMKDVDDLTFDDEYCRQSISKIVEADIAIFRDKFKCQHGIRGLADLLQIYKQHILSNIPDDEEKVDPKCFDPSSFDLKRAIQSIEDYNKGIDAKTAKHENMAIMVEKLNNFRSDLQQIPQHLAQKLLKIVEKLETKMDETGFLNLCTQLQFYRNRITLPDPQKIGELLKKNFAYLKAEKEGEVDCFSPIERVMKSIYLRLLSSRKGKPQPNNFISVTYTQTGLHDSSIYNTLGAILGDIPLIHVSNPDFVVSNPLNPQHYHITADHPIRKLFDSKGELMIHFPRDGKIKILAISKTGVKYGSFSYLLADMEDEIHLLTPKLAADIANVGNTGAISSMEGSLCVSQDCKGKKHDWNAILSDKFRPELRIMKRLAEMVRDTKKKSSDESLVTVLLGKEMLEKIEMWASQQTNPLQTPSFTLFLNEITNALKEPVKTSDGVPIDLSNLSFFFLTLKSSFNVKELEFPTGTLSLTVGTPPVGGRKIHAEQYFKKQLEVLQESFNETKELLGTFVSGNQEILPTEQEIFEHFVRYDQKVAEETDAKRMLAKLPLSHINKCIDNLVYYIQNRMSDTFSLGSEFPSLKSFQASWELEYGASLAAIELMILQIEKRKDEIKEAEEREAKAKIRADEIAALEHAKKLAKLQNPDSDEKEKEKEKEKNEKTEKKE